jgi:hypothetical protein
MYQGIAIRFFMSRLVATFAKGEHFLCIAIVAVVADGKRRIGGGEESCPSLNFRLRELVGDLGMLFHADKNA